MRTAFRWQMMVVVLFLGASANAIAAPEKPADGKSPDASRIIRDGYRLQDSDDFALPLRPVVPRSAAVSARNEALSWYMTGRLLDTNHRGEPAKALEAFRKAIKSDPEAIEIYRELVPLEFAAGNLEDAVRHAAKAAQLDPEDYKILQLLARQAAASGQLAEAIKHLELAVKSPRVEKLSPEYVVLNKSLGMLYVATGQKELAADCYEIVFDAIKSPKKFDLDPKGKNLLLSDPTSSYESIGQVFVDANRLKLALEAFELAGKSRMGAGSLSFNRARIFFLSDKYDDALAELDKYFDDQRTAKGRLPYQLLADILKKLNRSDELIGKLEELASRDTRNPFLQYFLADRLADVGELERARSIYDTMLRNGGDASGYVGLARVLRKMHKSDELLQALGRAFGKGAETIKEIEPEMQALSEDKELMDSLIEAGRARAKNDELKFEEAFLLANIAKTLKEADVSGEFYRKAIELNQNANLPSVLIQSEMAEMYLKLRRFKLAAETFEELLKSTQLSDAGRARFYSSLAQALAYDNRPDEALEAITKAIDIEDNNPSHRFYEAWICGHAKRWDEAFRKFDQLISDFSDQKELILLSQFTVSNFYVQKGDVRKGEEILEKILDTNPENSQVNNDLGYLWADQGKNLERSEKMIRKALASDPENPAYLDSLGWVLFKQDKFDEAIPPLEQATKRSTGGDGTIWDHLGDAMLKATKIDRAVEAWNKALKFLQEDSSSDPQLIERIHLKVKQHAVQAPTKPTEANSP